MKFLVDTNLSPRLAMLLAEAGFDVVHVADVGSLTASDEEIFDHAADAGCAIVTADSDFPMLLALRRASSPSVVLLRQCSELSPDEHAALLIANLPSVVVSLEKGAIASLSPRHVRVRDLPIRPPEPD